MKKFYRLFTLVLIPVAIIFLANSTGSPGGKTGSPGDGTNNCSQCHTGTPQTVTNWITTNIPANGYVPGQNYTITATGFHMGVSKFGFELTAEDAAGTKVGTFSITSPNETQLANNNKSVTHTLAGTIPVGNSKIWNMNWTAPAVSVGNVTFYAAFNAANGNGNNQGDVIYLSSHAVPPQVTGVDITFRVDMTEQTVSPLGVHIAGSFQGWNPGSTEMTLSENNIYTYTANFQAGEYYEYKFVNGNAWGMDETVPAGCAMNNNRYITIPNQNTVLDPICYGKCVICNPPLVSVTFRVDMTYETVSPNGVHIAGSFQGWNPATSEMTLAGNNIYVLQVDLPVGDYYEYKFINGNAWGADESVPPGCAHSNNRYLTVPPVPTTLDAVCFGSCGPCGNPPVDVDITFRVDMTYEVVSPLGVHIAGSFQGWNTGSTAMELVSDNIYEYTATLSSGTYHEYKFINGTAWGEDEIVPAECSQNNNRFIIVPDNNTMLPAVCFGSCTTCGPPPADINVTFLVDMSNEIVSPDGVHLAGTFQGWNASSTPMTDMGENIYSVTVTLLSGADHEYKFINGSSFDFTEIVPEACGVPDGQGGFNRFITVPLNDTTLMPLCFGSCDICLPPLPDHDITFVVDMANETVSPDGVHLAGSFQGWNASSTPMINTGNNIYQVTLSLEEGTYQEYKFINGITFDDAETIPGICAQNGNRYFTVPANDIILPAVCFASCNPCVPPLEIDVTFLVDMSNEVVSLDGIHIAGSFQGWDPTATELTALGENIYGITVSFIAGEYHEYKFVNGISFDGAEQVPETCGVPDGYGAFSRYFTTPQNDTTFDVVCFGSCSACVPPVPLHQVTFQVDMSYETISPDGVHLAGTFQGWDPTSTPMFDAGNNTYSVSLMLEEGSQQEFKFYNGNNLLNAEVVPPDCSLNGNRFLGVPVNDTILSLVCFSSCEPCGPPPVDVEVTFRVDMSNVDVSPLGVHITGSFQDWDPGATEMLPIGNEIYSYTAILQSWSYHEYKFVNGNQWGQDEIVPPGCSNNNNRFISVPDVDTTLTEVCFASCDTCIFIGIAENQMSSIDRIFNFYPNPASKSLYFIEPGIERHITIQAIDGKDVLNTVIGTTTLDVSGLNRGLYFIKIQNEETVLIKKLIIQ